MQGPALGPRQILGIAGNAAIAAHHPGHLRAGRNGQDRRHSVALALTFAELRHLSGKAFSQRSQLLRVVLAANSQRLLVRLQFLWKTFARKPLPGLGVQQPHPQLLGSVMGYVKVFRHPAKSRRRPQQDPIGSFVNSAAKELAVHESLQS